MPKEMNLAFGANFDLLKTNLSAMFEKDETGSRILLIPTKINSPTPVTLGEMVADFQKALGQKPEETDKIGKSLESVKKEGSPFDINKITFQLQAAFLYKNMPKEGESDPMEYALAISVDMADALPDFGFVKLNSLFIAVWNTERETVLKQIGTGQIVKMLASL